MEVAFKYLLDGTKDVEGLVVIIDVLRAGTTIPILFTQGAKKIISVSTTKEAEKYKDTDYVLVGEGKDGVRHEAFQYANSPSEIYTEDFSGKEIVFRSNNTSQAVLNANKASTIIIASFVNLAASVEFIKSKNPDKVTLVALGRLGERGLEDDLCAEAIKTSLEGKQFDFEKMKKEILLCECIEFVTKTLNRPKDAEMAVKLNSYPVVCQAIEENGQKVVVSQK